MPTSRRKAAWPHTSIHTPGSLARKYRSLDRRKREVEGALAELRRGASLHLSFSPRRHWRMSSGVFITDEVARVLITMPAVVAISDCLFDQSLSQTWRYTTENDNA
jgi:hypothetical protein